MHFVALQCDMSRDKFAASQIHNWTMFIHEELGWYINVSVLLHFAPTFAFVAVFDYHKHFMHSQHKIIL